MVVAERKIPAEAFFPSFSNCWNTPAMRWQLVKSWKALQETVLSTTRTSHPYQRATKRWQCHRESDLMGVLALKLNNTKLHLGRRGRSPRAQQPLPAHICPYPRELESGPFPLSTQPGASASLPLNLPLSMGYQFQVGSLQAS